MSTTSTPVTGRFEGIGDLRLVARQVYYEQLTFWLNPIGAILTIGFSVVFIVIFESTSQHATVDYLAHVDLGQYYLPAFAAYGVMAACFNILAIQTVNRREMGLLKRLRLSPLSTWMFLAATALSFMVVALIQVVLLLLVGYIGYGVHGPHDVVPFVLVLLVGMVAFTALGLGISTLVPNADACRTHGQPGVLHPGRPVGSLLPGEAALRTGRVHRAVPDPPHDHGVGRQLQRVAG